MRTTPFWLSITALAVGQALAQPPAPTPTEPPPSGGGGRGRDPWVFRCIFEDRTRMVILAPAPGVWIAFNPATGAIQKAWQGEMVFRGKVWDFSQDNSIAKGKTLLSRPSELARLPDSPGDSAGWTVTDATFDGGWKFNGPDTSIVSPAFNPEGFTRLFIAFDEKSRKGPVRVELSANGGTSWDAQWFDSTTHGSRDDEWQWNFKQILPEPTGPIQVRFRQTGDFAKRLKDVRVFGDQIAWRVGPAGTPGTPARVDWLGYELVNQTEGVILKFSVGDGHAAARVALRVDARAAGPRTEFTERYEVAGLPPGMELRLTPPEMTEGGVRVCSMDGARSRMAKIATLGIVRDGTYELVTTVGETEAK